MARGTLPGGVKALEDKLKPGRPRKQPPANAAELIREATARGATKLGVAVALDCALSVLERWLSESPELKEAFSVGREKERHALHSKLYETAMHGEGRDALLANMFLLKTRHAYLEGDQSEQGNRVSINFQLPGAQPLQQFTVIDNHEPKP